MKRLDLYVAPAAPRPEPTMSLRYEDEEVTITFTGLHNLLQVLHWRGGSYSDQDDKLRGWLESVCRRMAVPTVDLVAARPARAPVALSSVPPKPTFHAERRGGGFLRCGDPDCAVCGGEVS